MGLTRAIRRPRRPGSSFLVRSTSRSAAALQLGSELKMVLQKLALFEGVIKESTNLDPGVQRYLAARASCFAASAPFAASTCHSRCPRTSG